eukprot:9475584-Pyramimonas_sp.AAC.1
MQVAESIEYGLGLCWQWLKYDQRYAHCYPQIRDDGLYFHEPDGFTQNVALSGTNEMRSKVYPNGRYEKDQVTKKTEGVPVNFEMVTYNAISLTEAKSKKLTKAQREEKKKRLQKLRLQFHAENLLMVGMQEARGREGQQWADGYVTLRAGADAGGHG